MSAPARCSITTARCCVQTVEFNYFPLRRGDLVLDAVAGQSVVEHSSQERLELCSGFLCQQAGFSVYLPLVHYNTP